MDTLDLIMLLILAGIVGFYVGWVFRGVVIITNLARDPQRMIKMLEEIKQLNLEEAQGIAAIDAKANSQKRMEGVELELEVLKGYCYLYIKDNGEFVGQGPNIDQAMAMAKERFPTKTFWLGAVKQDSHTA